MCIGIFAVGYFPHNQMKLLDRLGVAFSQNGYLQQARLGVTHSGDSPFCVSVIRGVQIWSLTISALSILVPCFIWDHTFWGFPILCQVSFGLPNFRDPLILGAPILSHVSSGVMHSAQKAICMRCHLLPTHFTDSVFLRAPSLS